MRTLLQRIAAVLRPRRADERLDEEVRAHLELLAADYQRRGLSPEQARRAARRDFGGVEQMKETYRDRRGIPFVETLAQDVRYAVRTLTHHHPIGAQLTPDYPGEDDRPLTIVGVLEDSRYNNLRETSTGPMMWMPLQQAIYRINSIDLRVQPGAESAVAQRGGILRSVNPYLMVRRSTTLADQVQGTAARERLVFTVSLAFGGFALLLAAMGLHGTLAYKVARRTREIGVRLALDAQRSSVVGMFFRDALALAAAAAIVGVPLSLVAGWSLRAFLFGVEPRDPLTMTAACGVLALTVLIASCVPAFRASRVDPVLALRAE